MISLRREVFPRNSGFEKISSKTKQTTDSPKMNMCTRNNHVFFKELRFYRFRCYGCDPETHESGVLLFRLVFMGFQLEIKNRAEPVGGRDSCVHPPPPQPKKKLLGLVFVCLGAYLDRHCTFINARFERIGKRTYRMHA